MRVETGGEVSGGAEGSVEEAPQQATPDARTGARRWLPLVLRFGGTILIFGLLLARLDVGEVIAAMARTSLALWLATLCGVALIHLLAASKWLLLLNACGLSVEQRDALRAHFAGLFANTILPSIVGGDAIRLGMVVRDGSRLTAAATAGIADRATDVVALIVLATLAGGFVTLESVALQILFYAAGLLLAGIAVGVWVIRSVDASRLPARPAKAVSGLQLAITDLSRRKRAVIRALMVALIVQGAFVVLNVFIGNAIGIDVPPTAWFVAWPLAKLVALTPLSLGGLGVREGAIVALLLPFGVDPDFAMGEALVWYTQMLGIGLLGGALSWWMGRTPANAS